MIGVFPSSAPPPNPFTTPSASSISSAAHEAPSRRCSTGRYPSRGMRAEGMKKVMANPRLQSDANLMSFDGERMSYVGFAVILDA